MDVLTRVNVKISEATFDRLLKRKGVLMAKGERNLPIGEVIARLEKAAPRDI